ncbi:MAG: ATP-binding cassette domain-containing protein [Clostridia bacterium]|nr:ATP-binding cassette domain-containing protein [Clostridia bacterium]
MLELKNLVFEVSDEKGKTVRILDDVSLTVPDGKFYVITGPNGGGKSTLARVIMGLEKPTSGKIIYNGVDITDMDVTEKAKLGIGYAFQQPPRFKGLTVSKMLSLAAGKTLNDKECCTYLAKVGLCSAEYVKRELDSSLSGGEMKRIEIATLMARNPELAIFDEPEAGIDLWSFAMLVETFKNMQKKGGRTTVIISHQERIMTLADEMVVIADGKIKSVGERDEMLPKLMREFSPRCVKTQD